MLGGQPAPEQDDPVDERFAQILARPRAAQTAPADFEATLTTREDSLRRLVQTLDVIAQDPDYPIPPERGIVMGDPVFRVIGREFLTLLVTVGGLRPDADVLDAGCGGGRIAVPLTTYLRDGSYVGFDPHEDSIRWARAAITPRNPRVRFDFVDLYNSQYNPKGNIDPATTQLPYEDGAFDMVIATSLFTHMFAGETANYLREFARMLRPDGVVFTTAYLLNSSSQARVDDGTARYLFRHPHEGSLIVNPDNPPAAVAHPEPQFRAWAADAGLAIDRIAYGGWTNATRTTGQDLLLLRRDPPRP